MKRQGNMVPLLAAVGAVGALLYIWNNQRSLRAQTFRAATGATAAVGLQLPAGFRDVVLPESRSMPQFGVTYPTLGAPGTWGAGATNESWMVDTSTYHETLAMLTGSTGYGSSPAPSSSLPGRTHTSVFGVRAPTL